MVLYNLNGFLITHHLMIITRLHQMLMDKRGQVLDPLDQGFLKQLLVPVSLFSHMEDYHAYNSSSCPSLISLAEPVKSQFTITQHSAPKHKSNPRQCCIQSLPPHNFLLRIHFFHKNQSFLVPTLFSTHAFFLVLCIHLDVCPQVSLSPIARLLNLLHPHSDSLTCLQFPPPIHNKTKTGRKRHC